jgi:hypothetical protein
VRGSGGPVDQALRRPSQAGWQVQLRLGRVRGSGGPVDQALQ